MDYVQVEPTASYLSNPALWITLCILAIVAVVLVVRSVKKPENGPVYFAAFLLILFTGLVVFSGFDSAASQQEVRARNAQLEQVRSQIETRYNVKLSEEQAKSLDYPESKPQSSFETFGSFVSSTPNSSDNGFTQTKIVLAWQNGKMVLGQSTDGESFKQLHQSE